MKLLVNGDPCEVPDGLTVSALLQHLAIDGLVAVEVDREVVPRAQRDGHSLRDGAQIEIVHFVGGG